MISFHHIQPVSFVLPSTVDKKAQTQVPILTTDHLDFPR